MSFQFDSNHMTEDEFFEKCNDTLNLEPIAKWSYGCPDTDFHEITRVPDIFLGDPLKKLYERLLIEKPRRFYSLTDPFGVFIKWEILCVGKVCLGSYLKSLSPDEPDIHNYVVVTEPR